MPFPLHELVVPIPRTDWFKHKYYVYGLTLPDSFHKGMWFYVGKGKGDRIFRHESNAFAGENSPKAILIREAWKAGHEVGHHILFQTNNEREAYAKEDTFITGMLAFCDLTNLTHGLKMTQAERDRRREEEQVDSLWKALCKLYSEDDKETVQALMDGIIARGLMGEIFGK